MGIFSKAKAFGYEVMLRTWIQGFNPHFEGSGNSAWAVVRDGAMSKLLRGNSNEFAGLKKSGVPYPLRGWIKKFEDR